MSTLECPRARGGGEEGGAGEEEAEEEARWGRGHGRGTGTRPQRAGYTSYKAISAVNPAGPPRCSCFPSSRQPSSGAAGRVSYNPVQRHLQLLVGYES